MSDGPIHTWRDISFTFDERVPRDRNMVVGLTFPRQDAWVALEPSILHVLPPGNSAIYDPHNHDYNSDDVDLFLCSVYIAGEQAFREWAAKHDRSKIVVGGYHPTSFPGRFTNLAAKIVRGPCDDIEATLAQDGQIVNGITSFKRIPRYDLYDFSANSQVIPNMMAGDRVCSISTGSGCHRRCDFCCTPLISPRRWSKPIELVREEASALDARARPQWCFIRDENFLVQHDWDQRLDALFHSFSSRPNFYMFASADLVTEERAKFLADHRVYMVCLGLEDPTVDYGKNERLDDAVDTLKRHGIYVYLSFIVDPLKVISREAGAAFYDLLMNRVRDLAPEMICGNFLMPFPGTKLWDKYYAYISPDDFVEYDTKTPVLIRNPVVRQKMQWFLFWHQWQYYSSDFYQNTVGRDFACGDTLNRRFADLYCQFVPLYRRVWNERP